MTSSSTLPAELPIAAERAGAIDLRLATAADDGEIRALLAGAPVEGPIVLSYEREPDYFLGCSVMGRRVDTLVARLRSTGELVGLATRAVRPLWINGKVQDVGYLGHLRVSPRYRGRSLVQRGFRLLRSLDGHTLPGYVTTIVEGNVEALGVLVRRSRPGMPAYRERCRVRTLVIPTLHASRARRGVPVEVSGAAPEQPGPIVEFLRRVGRERQFFPAYEAADFLPGSGLTRGFEAGNFLVAMRNGDIAGVLGVWDQSAFKQVVVRGYRGLLACLRPIVARTAHLGGYPAPPRPPALLRIAYASFLAIEGDRTDTFAALLAAARDRAARLGCDYLTLALADGDPLLPSAQALPHRTYASRLFTVDWRAGGFHDEVARGIPYVDIASF